MMKHDPACIRTREARLAIDYALDYLKRARYLLRRADARRAYERVAADVKSVEGALRHADGQRDRAEAACAFCQEAKAAS